MNSKLISSLRQNLPFIVGILFVTIAIISAATRSISNPGVWFDESGQFWMSLGLNHFSTPRSGSGGLSEVLGNNAGFNLDPGGFTLILRGWMHKFGRSVESLRALPFSFFVANCILLIKICLKINIDRRIAYLSPFLLVANPLQLHYAFEIRPYSAEATAWLLALYSSLLIPSILSTSLAKQAALGTILATMIWLRYSVIVPVFAFSAIALWFLLLRFRLTIKKRVANAIAILAPILISCVLIYFVTLQHQNSGGDAPSYVQDLMLKYTSFKDIFFVKSALVIWVPWGLVVIATIVARSRGNSQHIFKLNTRNYIIFSSLSCATLFLFSIVGKYPLAFRSRWDIGINVIFSISIIIFLDAMVKLISKYSSDKSLGFLVFIALLFCILPFRYAYGANDSVYESITQCRSDLESGEIRKMIGNRNSLPTVKYLYEYGPLSSRQDEYREFKWFYSPSEPLTKQLDSQYQADVDSLDFNNYDVVVLTHFDKDDSFNSRLIERIEESHALCSTAAPSLVYEKKPKESLK
jgi:hypothetical protein